MDITSTLYLIASSTDQVVSSTAKISNDVSVLIVIMMVFTGVALIDFVRRLIMPFGRN